MRAAITALEQLELDLLLLIPSAMPPHKDLPDDSPSGPERLDMLRMASRDIPRAQISDIELLRVGKSYTVDTLTELKSVYPDSRLFLLMGYDMFKSFDNWYQPDVICSLAAIAPFNRRKRDETKSPALVKHADRLRNKFNAEIVIVDNNYIEISSTALRIILLAGLGEKYLNNDVYAHIQAEGYYGLGRDMRELSLDELRSRALGLVEENRRSHVLGCEETAAALALRWGYPEQDARRAAMLHDVTKALSIEEQLILCDKYGIILDDIEKTNESLLHAKSGAAYASEIFGQSPEICSAIRWHTTGRPEMTLFEKIIYLADYIEPTRTFPGVEGLRNLSFENLDEAMLLGATMALAEVARKSNVHPNTAQALAYFQSLNTQTAFA